MAIGQFYHVAVDNQQAVPRLRRPAGQRQLGRPEPERCTAAGPINEDWICVGGGDGFVCRVDPNDPDLVYSESQDGSMGRAQPAHRRARLASGRRRRAGQPPLPLQLEHAVHPVAATTRRSSTAAATTSSARSTRATTCKIISPEITRTKRGSATALAESPRNPDVLWAGTDDGDLWVTRDGGKNWTNVTDKVGLPEPRWVATIEPSRFAEGRAYVAFDAHRSDDDEPYVFVTEDFGQTWKSLRGNLPGRLDARACARTSRTRTCSTCGTEFAVWASLDRGESWTKINNNLPTVAVHEFAIHPTAGEIVAATHGRSLWILDVTPLRQMTAAVVEGAGAPVRAAAGGPLAVRAEPRLAVRHRQPPLRRPEPAARRQFYYSLTRRRRRSA